MAYTQPHPRLSVVSTSSQSSLDHLSPTTTSTRFSLPSISSANTAVASTKPGPNRPNIYDRNLNKTRGTEVSGAAFAFLFSEIVQYTQKRVSGINDLERQWVVYHIGITLSESILLHEDWIPLDIVSEHECLNSCFGGLRVPLKLQNAKSNSCLSSCWFIRKYGRRHLENQLMQLKGVWKTQTNVRIFN